MTRTRWPYMLVVLVLPACQLWFQDDPVKWSGETMGTTYSVMIADELEQGKAALLQADIQAALDAVNADMSTYIPDSSLSQFNRSGSTDWQAVPQALADVVAEAQNISRLSDGAFDVTVAPLVNLWGFGPQASPQELPSSDSINEALAKVGYQNLHVRLDPPALKKDLPNLSVDLSAIAKGYAVDQMAQVLMREGVMRFLVEIGGELRALGTNHEGKPWQIGIEKPVNIVPREAMRVVQLDGMAIATSGDYKNYLQWEGQRYSHEINPRSGYPVRHKTALVSVVAESAMQADGWATALLVLGSVNGLELAQKSGLAVYFIVRTEEGFEAFWNESFSLYE